MKTPTSWANNDVKPAASWAPVVKQKTLYVDNITKVPTAFTPVSKQNSAWLSALNASSAWLYDDATQKYDDTPVRGYDYLIPTTNTINNKMPTAWNTP